MLTLKEPEADDVCENIDEPEDHCEENNAEDNVENTVNDKNGHKDASILRNALLSIQDDEGSKEFILPDESMPKKKPNNSSIKHWNIANTEEQVSYIASVPNGKNFIIITRLEPVTDKTLIEGKGLKLTNEATLDISDKNCHQLKQHNKVILLRKIVSQEEPTESTEENSKTINEERKEPLPNMTNAKYDKVGLGDDADQRSKDSRESVSWLKSFSPLPLYYTDRGKPYLKCPACGAMFFTSTYFQKHLFSHMYKETDKYVCSFCNYTHAEPGMLFTHLSKHQDQCEQCNENLLRKNNFEKHWNGCSSSFCMKRDHRGRFVCSECKLVFDLLPQVEKHWFKHACKRGRTYQCKECSGLYDSKETLQNHKCLQCPVCGEVYDNLHRLKAHTMWMKHNLKCLICSYEFILTMDHEKHLAMHREVYRPTENYLHCLQSADGKTFQCDLCDKIFYALPRLVLHLEEDHGVEKVKKEVEDIEKIEADKEQDQCEIILNNLNDEPINYGIAKHSLNRLNDDDFETVL